MVKSVLLRLVNNCRGMKWIFFLLTMIGLGGCHSPIAVSHAQSGLTAYGKYEVIRGIDLPRVQGVAGCGAQALAGAIAFVDVGVEAEALGTQLPWHDRGATPVELLIEARRRGYEASLEQGSWERLEESVNEGAPMLVMFDAGYEIRWFFSRYDLPRVMHWGLVSGMARDGSTVLLAARDGRHHIVAREEFERRWAKSDRCLIGIHAGAGQP